jgi:predicted RNase H-like HicB family nuclease
MLVNYTAQYTKTDSGYMGQLIEWTEVVTEGKDIEECRDMLKDALNEMILAYQQQGQEIPAGGSLFEQIPIDVKSVCQTA